LEQVEFGKSKQHVDVAVLYVGEIMEKTPIPRLIRSSSQDNRIWHHQSAYPADLTPLKELLCNMTILKTRDDWNTTITA
jgi:hypothetical protein